DHRASSGQVASGSLVQSSSGRSLPLVSGAITAPRVCGPTRAGQRPASTAFDHSDRVRECGRPARYRLADLLMRYGRNEKVFAFTEDVTLTAPATRCAATVVHAVRSIPICRRRFEAIETGLEAHVPPLLWLFIERYAPQPSTVYQPQDQAEHDADDEARYRG